MPTLRHSIAVSGAAGVAGGDLAGTYPDPSVAQASGAFALPGDISPATIAADQNDYNPAGLAAASTLRLTASSAVNITGLAGASDGRLIAIHNIGANAITLKDENAGSTAGNRFALTSDLVLAPDECCVLQYDSTSSRWRVVGAARVPYGTAANTVCQGNDSRLSDSRTPAAHETSHKSGGSDAFLSTDLLDAIVKRLQESGGPTTLIMGTVADGKFLKRSGTSVVGDTPSATLDIDGLTAADPALGDEGPIYDVSAAANRKITLDKLGFLLRFHAGGRLTLTSGTPVTTSDVTAAGTLYYAIYSDDQVALYDGTRWRMYTFTERSLSLSVTSGKNYDVFLYDNSGTLTLELSAAWTNDATRADALARQDGVWVKSGAATRRYLGTIRGSGTSQCEDSFTKRFVWNADNRVARRLFQLISAYHTYSTASWRQFNSDATAQVAYVCGLVEDAQALAWSGLLRSSGTGNNIYVGWGKDSTTSPGMSEPYAGIWGGANQGDVGSAETLLPSLGYHYLAQIEYGNATGTPEFWTHGLTVHWRM